MDKVRFNTWGDAEADRLWREMYEAEVVLNDLDLATESQNLHKAMDAAKRFHQYMDTLNARPSKRMA